jgi:hypothetical protein
MRRRHLGGSWTILAASVALSTMATACSATEGNSPTAGSVSISPSAASVGVGYHQAYRLTVRDSGGKVLPDAVGVFTISPDGSCTRTVCAPSKVGLHVVTATYAGQSAFADLNVTPGGYDHLDILPRFPQITAGSPFTFTAVNANSHGDPISDVTDSATFSISVEGSCAANVCTAFVAHGGQLLTVAQADHVSHFVLQVNAGKLTRIDIEPGNATVAAGTGQTYTATGYDAYHNPVENAYGATNFAAATKATLTITPDGSCAQATCTPSRPGTHLVTIRFSGETATATLVAM